MTAEATICIRTLGSTRFQEKSQWMGQLAG